MKCQKGLGEEHCGDFSQIFERHRIEILQLLRCLGGNSEDHQEIVQEVFHRLHAKKLLEDESMSCQSVQALLRRIAVNLAVDEGRRVVRVSEAMESAPASTQRAGTPRDFAEAWELADRTIAVLLTLPHTQQDAFVYCALEKRSYDEAATAMNTTTGAVKQHLHRARTRLSQSLSGL